MKNIRQTKEEKIHEITISKKGIGLLGYLFSERMANKIIYLLKNHQQPRRGRDVDGSVWGDRGSVFIDLEFQALNEHNCKNFVERSPRRVPIAVLPRTKVKEFIKRLEKANAEWIEIRNK